MWDGFLNWKVGGERAMTLAQAVEHIKTRYCRPAKLDPSDEAQRRIEEVNRKLAAPFEIETIE